MPHVRRCDCGGACVLAEHSFLLKNTQFDGPYGSKGRAINAFPDAEGRTTVTFKHTKNGTRYVCPVVNGRTCGMMQWGYGGALISVRSTNEPFRIPPTQQPTTGM